VKAGGEKIDAVAGALQALVRPMAVVAGLAASIALDPRAQHSQGIQPPLRHVIADSVTMVL